jgi:chromosome segregation ATPase
MDEAVMQEASPPSADIVRIPLDPQVRLRAALRMLETRLDQQRAGIAVWREEMVNLSNVIRELRDNVETWQHGLDGLASQVATARETAVELDHNVDRLLDASRKAIMQEPVI